MAKKRKGGGSNRRFTEEFKRESVRLWQESGRTQRAIASELGIGSSTLAKWATQQGVQDPVEVVDVAESAEDELKRLRKRVRELEMEREILKKATAFFAKESE